MKQLAVLMCVVLMSAEASALSFLGKTTAELKKGQWKAAYILSHSELDLEGTEEDGDKYTFESGRIIRNYLGLGHGLADNIEVNLLLGFASVDFGNFEYDGGGVSPGDFHSSDDFSWGFNAKYTLVDGETIDWGAMLQMTWLSGDGKWEGYKEEFDAYDLQIAVGPTIDMGCWDLYGGGYFYKLDGELEATYPNGSRIWIDDLEEEDSFGGFVGAAFKIMKNTSVAIECAFSDDTLGIGVSCGCRF